MITILGSIDNITGGGGDLSHNVGHSMSMRTFTLIMEKKTFIRASKAYEENDNGLNLDMVAIYIIVCFISSENDKGELTHTLIPYWFPSTLPPRDECMGWFALPVRKVG